MSDENDVRSMLDWITGAGQMRSSRPSPLRLGSDAVASVSPIGNLRESFPWAFAPGVVGLGVAEKITSGKRLPDVALKLYVEKKLPISALGANAIPKIISIPGVGAVETDVVEIGQVKLQSLTQRVRPALPGYSVGRALDAAVAGTFGMLVRKVGQDKPFYLLSNAHAIAASGFATKGDAIIQPGGADGGKAPADQIGTLTEWVPLVFSSHGFSNLVDAAIAEMDDNAASAAIAQLGVPKGVNLNLKRGDYVQKMGRTTTLSVARVEDIDMRLPSTYPDANGQLGRVGFSDQVLVTYYSAGGDSGSPVLDMNRNIVGLHVAGSTIIGIFCKIKNVMAQLGVEVVTEENLDPNTQAS